jgi:predicted transcriptional regulator
MPSKISAPVKYAGAGRPASDQEMVDDAIKQIVEVLIIRRMMLGMSQVELNNKIGCAENHLAKWEAGLYRPRLHHLLRWCAALGYCLTLKDMQ